MVEGGSRTGLRAELGEIPAASAGMTEVGSAGATEGAQEWREASAGLCAGPGEPEIWAQSP